MASNSRHSRESFSIWPGYVDVLSALIMIIIFVLLIFTLSQFILSSILSDQNNELEDLHLRIAEISGLLGLEQETNAAMTEKIATLSAEIEVLTIDRSTLQGEIESLTERRIEDREIIEVQLRTIASLQHDIQSLQALRQELESQIGAALAALSQEESLTKSLRDRSKTLEARLADEQEKTLLAQKDIEQRDIRIQALYALVGEQKQALENQRSLTADAQAEIALLSQKINQLRSQLAQIGKALKISELEREEQTEQISDLGKRLNIELARKVNDLERYRSEFFGRLREIVADNPMVRVEGDRFLLQAELLFPSGTAVLSDQGKGELQGLATVLKEISSGIPDDLHWILRVDGHTDKVPISTGQYPSNWELSTARAVSVVRYLASQGIPEARMAAAGFSKFHPIDPADTAQAYRKNRRIEIKLTSR